MEGSTAGERFLKVGIAIMITAVLEIFGLGWIGAIYLLYVLWQWTMHTVIHENDTKWEDVRRK